MILRFFTFFLCCCISLSVAEQGEVYVKKAPEQFFACEAEEITHDARWQILFPHRPAFRYACAFFSACEREFGFYLEGNILHWARAAGRSNILELCYRPRLKAPFVDFRDIFNVDEEWTDFDERDYEEDVLTFPQLMRLGAAVAELHLNKEIYADRYVKRGSFLLEPKAAKALYHLLAIVLPSRTYSMPLFRKYCRESTVGESFSPFDVNDGEYAYYRGEDGCAAQDFCYLPGRFRSSMLDLSFALVDMATAGDKSAETQAWILAQCERIAKMADELGTEPPPMVGDEWTREYVKKLATEPKKDEPPSPEPKWCRAPEPRNLPKALAIRFRKECRERYHVPLEKNPLWKDLFPAGAAGKPAAMWTDNGALYGIVLDGDCMVCASALITHPLQSFADWFLEGKKEVRMMPYDGDYDSVVLYDTGFERRVCRDWIFRDGEKIREIADLFRQIALGVIPPNDEGREGEGDELLIIRGADGSFRVMTPETGGYDEVLFFLTALKAFGSSGLASYEGDEWYLDALECLRGVYENRFRFP